MIIEWIEIMYLQKIKEKKEGRRGFEGRKGERELYGYHLRMVPVKYMKSVLFT